MDEEVKMEAPHFSVSKAGDEFRVEAPRLSVVK